MREMKIMKVNKIIFLIKEMSYQEPLKNINVK